MTSYRVRNRKGDVLTVSSQEQVERWAQAGYALVDEPKPAAKKAAPRKRTAKKKS